MFADCRLLSMSWITASDGVVRLNEFDTRLNFTFAKTTADVEFTSVTNDPTL